MSLLNIESINGRIKFLLKDSVLYGLASQIARLVNIITIPIIAKVFSETEYVVFDSINILGYMFVSIIIMGQDSSVARYYYEYESSGDKKQVISQAMIIEFLLSIIVCGALIASNSFIMDVYLKTGAFDKLMLIFIISLPFRVFTQFWQNLLKWTFRRMQYILMTIGLTVVIIAGVLFSVYYTDFGLEGVFYSFLFAHLLFAFIGFFFCRDLVAMPKNLALTPKLFSYGLSYFIVGIIGQLYTVMDREIITRHYSLSELAIYSMAFRIVTLLRIPIGGFQMAWGPFAYSLYKQENINATYNKVLHYYISVITLFSVWLILGSEVIIRLFSTSDYTSGVVFILPLAFSFVFDTIADITGIGIDLSKKAIYSSISYMISLVITYLLMVLLVGIYGIMGIAIAILLGKIILVIVKTSFAYKLYNLRFDFTKTILITIMGGLISTVFVILHQNYHLAGIIYSVAMAIIFPISLWFVLDKEDRRSFFSMIKSKLKMI